MTRTELIKYLRSLNACNEAIAWIEKTPGEPEDLWATCRRGDWLLCLLDAVAYDARTMRHIACDIAEGTLHIYEQVYPNDPRPRNCIAVARRYAGGEATDDELLAAWRAAEKAARATSDAAVDAAAKSVVWAVFGDATKAASWAAISNAALAEFVETSAAAWDAAMVRHADMIRARVSWADVERLMERAAREEKGDA